MIVIDVMIARGDRKRIRFVWVDEDVEKKEHNPQHHCTSAIRNRVLKLGYLRGGLRFESHAFVAKCSFDRLSGGRHLFGVVVWLRGDISCNGRKRNTTRNTIVPAPLGIGPNTGYITPQPQWCYGLCSFRHRTSAILH